MKIPENFLDFTRLDPQHASVRAAARAAKAAADSAGSNVIDASDRFNASRLTLKLPDVPSSLRYKGPTNKDIDISRGANRIDIISGMSVDMQRIVLGGAGVTTVYLNYQVARARAFAAFNPGLEPLQAYVDLGDSAVTKRTGILIQANSQDLNDPHQALWAQSLYLGIEDINLNIGRRLDDGLPFDPHLLELIGVAVDPIIPIL